MPASVRGPPAVRNFERARRALIENSGNLKEAAMTTIIPFSRDEAFDPAAVQAMSIALEEVCRRLQVDGDQRARETMALRIIELARRGERNPERLRDQVLQEAGASALLVPPDPFQR
jgi:hypothetical protein